MSKTRTEKEAIQEATKAELAEAFEPEVVRYQSPYVRRLLAERHYVYSRLFNQGGSVILQSVAADIERGEQPSGVIGSSIHNELIDLAIAMKSLTKGERDALFAWSDGLTAAEAAPLLSVKGKIRVTSPEAVRQRNSRSIKKLTEVMNEDA